VVSATGPHGRYSRFSRPEPLLFHSSSSSVVVTRLSGPHSRPPYLSEKLVGPGIEPGTSGSVIIIVILYITWGRRWTNEADVKETVLC
jgi:hypothetical protein